MIHVYDDKEYKNPFRPDGTLRREVDALLKQSTITRNQCIIPSTTYSSPSTNKVPLKTCIPKVSTSSKDRTVRFSPSPDNYEVNYFNNDDIFNDINVKSNDLVKFSFTNGNNVNAKKELIFDDRKEAIVEQPVKVDKLGAEHNHLVVENVNIQVEKCCKIV